MKIKDEDHKKEKQDLEQFIEEQTQEINILKQEKH
jgi:hypothetical protein